MNRLSFLFIVTILFLSSDIYSQRDRRAPDDRDPEETSKIWYGGNIGLGFAGGFLQASLEPMLGYKLDKKGVFSVGPRLSLEYVSISRDGFGQRIDAQSSLNYGLALFARAKIYQGFFGHVEYEKLSAKIAQSSFSGGGITFSDRQWIDNYFLGGGYNASTGGFSGELAILFNLNPNNINLNQDGLEYRAGFTFNF